MSVLEEATKSEKNAGVLARKPTKRDRLIKLLRTRSGADLPTISAKFGWLPHTARAAISGLRKAGYEIALEKSPRGGKSRYRLMAPPNKAMGSN